MLTSPPAAAEEQVCLVGAARSQRRSSWLAVGAALLSLLLLAAVAFSASQPGMLSAGAETVAGLPGRLSAERGAAEGSRPDMPVESVVGPAGWGAQLGMPSVGGWLGPSDDARSTVTVERTPLSKATPTTELIEMPPECDSLDDTALGKIIDYAVRAYLRSLHLPSAPDKSRSRLWLGGGASAVLYDQSTLSLSLGSMESAMCSKSSTREQAALNSRAALPIASARSMGKGADEAHRIVEAAMGEENRIGAEDVQDSPFPAVDFGRGGAGDVRESLNDGLGNLRAEIGDGLDGLGDTVGNGLHGLGSVGSQEMTGIYRHAVASAEAGWASAHSWMGRGKSMLVRLYDIHANVHAKYELDSTMITRLLVGSGKGTIDASVVGLLLFDRIDLESLVWSGGRNGTIRDCFGMFGIATLAVHGAIDHFENNTQPVNSATFARELCYGPEAATWDDTLGPRPRGLVAHINEAIMEWMWPVSGKTPFGDTNAAADSLSQAPTSATAALKMVVSSPQQLPTSSSSVGPQLSSVQALHPVRCQLGDGSEAAASCAHEDNWRWVYAMQHPPPPPFDSCDCTWTSEYACPSWPMPGSLGYAKDDGGECFNYCCCTCEWVEEYACPGTDTPGSKGFATDDGGVCFRECCMHQDGDNSAAMAVGGTLLLAAGVLLLG